MNFDTPFFLFVVLPLALILAALAPRRWRFGVLLGFSLLFYAWIEPFWAAGAGGLAVLTWFLGGRIRAAGEDEKKAKAWLTAGVLLNVGVLLGYRLLDYNFTGISFFTFTALAYLFDVYNQLIQPKRNFWQVLFHLFFFPKVMAGPITRYAQTESQLGDLRVDLRAGVTRFMLGLAKKVLLAIPIGILADNIFSNAAASLTPAVAWLGAAAYTLQIYFDFSGYTDMAIGLGLFFGIRLPENFNYPYLADGIADFWRRWHITLSSWFRDYVFFPLEFGRRKSRLKWRQTANILVVFALTGIWHGLGLTFLAWGLLHGLCIALETRFSSFYQRIWPPLRHAYALLVIMAGWVFFRSTSLAYALGYLQAMFGLNNPPEMRPLITLYATPYNLALLVIGILCALPILPWLQARLEASHRAGLRKGLYGLGYAALAILFLLAIFGVAENTYQTFIYFKF